MTKLPAIRRGRTTKYKVGGVSVYVTVNIHDGRVREIFSKCNLGYQGWADCIATMASLALRSGCPAETVARHLRFRRYEPAGGPGQPCSISDAMGRAIEEAI